MSSWPIRKQTGIIYIVSLQRRVYIIIAGIRMGSHIRNTQADAQEVDYDESASALYFQLSKPSARAILGVESLDSCSLQRPDDLSAGTCAIVYECVYILFFVILSNYFYTHKVDTYNAHIQKDHNCTINICLDARTSRVYQFAMQASQDTFSASARIED